MRLSILTINEETRQIEVPDDSTLADLKALVARSFDMAESRFSLIFRGRNVKSNNDTLASMQIVDGSVLHFVPRIVTNNLESSGANREDPPTQERRPLAFQYLEQFATFPFQNIPVINSEDGSLLTEVIQDMQRVVNDLRRIETSSEGLLSTFNSSQMPSMFGARLSADFSQLLPLIMDSVSCVRQIFNNFNGMNHNNDVSVSSTDSESHHSHTLRVWNEFMEILRSYAGVLDMLSHSEVYNDTPTSQVPTEQFTVYRLRNDEEGSDAPPIYVGRRSGPSRSPGQASDRGSANASTSTTAQGTASTSTTAQGTASTSTTAQGTASTTTTAQGTASTSTTAQGTASTSTTAQGTAQPGLSGQGPNVSAERNQQGASGTQRSTRSIVINARLINSSSSPDQPVWISSINQQILPSRNTPSQPHADMTILSLDVQRVIANDVSQFIQHGNRLKYPNSIGFLNGFPGSAREINQINKASDKLTSLDRIIGNDRNILRLSSSDEELQDAFNEFLRNKNLNKMFAKYVAAKVEKKLNE